MKKSAILTVIVCIMVASLPISAQTYPWHEDFDGGLGPEWANGRDDPALGAPAPGNKPSPECDGGNISSGACSDGIGRLLDAGGGNLVYYSENHAFVACRGFVGLRGTVPYPRSDAPVAIAELFIISAAPESGEANGAGAGVFGAWHTIQGTAGWAGGGLGDPGNCPPQSDTLEKDLELGTHHWPGWKLTYVDGVRGFFNCVATSTPPCPQLALTGGLREISRPSAGALSKPHPMGAMDTLADQVATGTWFMRWELDPVQGGLIQFASTYDRATDTANGGAGWVTIKDLFGMPIDTRGVANGGIGSTPTVFLGFGGFKHFAMANVWVDTAITPNPVELKWWELE
jgi:hypothetical protein